MLGRRSSKFRYVPLVGLLGATLAASLVPGVAGADQSISTDVPEWAQDTGESTPDAMTTQAALPQKYDLRDDGLVTPVKQQGPFQSCWSFGGTAACESSLLSAAGTTYAETVAKGNPLNLSERHLVWYSLTPVSAADDPAQAGEGTQLKSEDINAPFDNGGNSIMMTSLYAQGVGPLPEAAFPYRGKDARTTLDDFDEDSDTPTHKEIQQVAAAQQPAMTEDEYIAAKAAEWHVTTEQAYERMKAGVRANTANSMTYSSKDDWRVPAVDGMGRSTRLLTAGYVLKSGNFLPDYWVGGAINTDAQRAMKQELLNGRGIMLTYHAPGPADVGTTGKTFANTTDAGGVMFSQYVYDDNQPPNHGVCIVGYDDNYDAGNFAETPPGNGAWIVKNSWGSETDCEPDEQGNVVSRKAYGAKNAEGKATGYFYLSYYDKTISGQETVEFNTNLAGQGTFQTMQYDYMNLQAFKKVGGTEDVTSSANVFKADENIVVRSASTMTGEENMRVTLAVYLLDDGAINPTDGTLVARASNNFEYSGFHRVDLDNPIDVKAGQRVAVVSTASKVSTDGKRVYEASASSATKDSATAVTTAVVNKGESFVYKDGVWKDWKDYLTAENDVNNSVDNFSIKLYATPGEPDPVEEGQEILRLYNPYSGEHFYTSSTEERDQLVDLGWKDEGLGWVAPKADADPVHRLYNPYGGDHHYTVSAEERDQLVDLGWKYEGVCWLSGGDVPVYRQYNPNAQVGSHNFTTSKDENDQLVSAGWNEEGIAWMSMAQ